MKDNFDELKSLKEMLNQGAISDSEFEIMKADIINKSMAKDGVKSAQKPNAFYTFIKKFKWLFVGVIIFIGLIIFIYNSMQKDPVEEGEKLALEYCDCQQKNNEEYINQLNLFISGFDSSKIKFSNDITNKLYELESAHMSKAINQDVSDCFSKINLKLEDAIQYFKKGSSDEKKFLKALENKFELDANLSSQNQEILDLTAIANSLGGNICYTDQDELENRKNNIDMKMNYYYSSLSNESLDAFDYFSYKVDRFITRKNVTPTDINLIINQPSDYQNQKWKVASETIHLKSCLNDIETWEYASEFTCYRPSREEWQISNVIYEVKFNTSDRITSYREIKVEKTQYFSSEEYDEINNHDGH